MAKLIVVTKSNGIYYGKVQDMSLVVEELKSLIEQLLVKDLRINPYFFFELKEHSFVMLDVSDVHYIEIDTQKSAV